MKKNNYSAMLAGIMLFIFLFVFSEKFIQGINVGLLNCAKIVIPSLFPFLIASSLSGSGKLPKTLKKLLEPLSQFLFRLPAESLPCIFLGQTGGYLSGAKAAQTLYSNGLLSKSQANRMLIFCINAGMGFSINAVGNAMLCSREAGRVLLAALCISSLVTGVFISRVFPDSPKEKGKKAVQNNTPFSSAVVNSVSSASQAMLTACAFVALFSGIGAVTDEYIKNDSLRLAVSCLLEVTKVCADAAGKVSLPALASICAFGGLCVHMQIFSIAQSLELKIVWFYGCRLLHSALAYAVCKIILYFHPVEMQVFLSFSENAEVFSFSAPAAISLLFLCILLILDLDNNPKMCYT
ncbi:MAG: hypothetical protein E7547_08220 [Ruminococcaceae bacterium]|nr:hypothetical protein [Oscillospiraceae bacterium]